MADIVLDFERPIEQMVARQEELEQSLSCHPELADELNKFFAESYADGSMMECAEEYGVQASIIPQN